MRERSGADPPPVGAPSSEFGAPRTAIVALSHVFFTTGGIQETRPIADAARRHGAFFLLDAYQSAGQVPIDVRALGVDALDRR
jgi:selenocysteine lyase/cysteine desulfurase